MAEDIAEEIDGKPVSANNQAMQAVFDRAMQRFNYTVPPQTELRAQALAARRFCTIPGAQWEGQFGECYENSIRLEIDKTARGVEKIVRDYRANRIVPDFRPKGGSSDQEAADTLDGMHRADSNHFKSQQARDNAFEEAAAGGFGAYRLTTAWADPLDKESDEQRINPAMTIVDADQRVFFGPSLLYDKSDSKFCFVLTAHQRQLYEEEHKGCIASWPDNLWKVWYDWFQPDIVITAEYYEVEQKKENLLIFRHVLTMDEQRWWESDVDADEIAELEAMGYTITKKKRDRQRVRKYLMSGAEVLKDYGYIPGNRIPVVPVYGKRWFVDNMERFEGYVQKRMDRQRVYNGQISKLAETNALAPREKPIFAAQQMPPHLAEQWANQEINRHPYALVEPLIDPATGQMVSLGPIGKIEPPQLEPVTALLLQAASQDLTEDMQDPDEVVANTSAEAMDMAATRVDAKSALYLDNMAQSAVCEGEIYAGMCGDVYWQDGRTVETMSEDGDDGEATLREPYTNEKGEFGLRNDFLTAKFKVVVDVTEATKTRREKSVKANLKVAEVAGAAGDQELGQVALLTAVMNLDGEGTTDMQKYARKRLVGLGVVEPNEEEQAELEAAQQNQQPGADQVVLLAQAEALGAQAEKDKATAAKTQEEIALTKAKTIDTLAAAEQKGADAELRGVDTMIKAHDADTRRHVATKPEPANDTEMRPKIRRGNDF